MAAQSPLTEQHLAAEAPLLTYGPAAAGVQIAEAFDDIELEYAALRKASALLDQPHRATIRVTGGERIDFLNNMITAELKDIKPHQSRRAFWLSRKGRIDADLRFTQLEDHAQIDVDIHALERTLETLNAYIITEDCELHDESATKHRLALHGTTSAKLLDLIASDTSAEIASLKDNEAATATIAGAQVLIERQDTAAVPGFEITTDTDKAQTVYNALLEAGRVTDDTPEHSPARDIKLRAIGWHAYNTARIEAGTPLFNLDFTHESLPAETGEATLNDRVSFTKGCYLGQEVVSRMHHLGKPKQVLVALKPDTTLEGQPARDEKGHPLQPLGGTPVFTETAPNGDPVGMITSSTISPLLGATQVCFAIIKGKHATEGTNLIVPAEGQRLIAPIRTNLRFI